MIAAADQVGSFRRDGTVGLIFSDAFAVDEQVGAICTNHAMKFVPAQSKATLVGFHRSDEQRFLEAGGRCNRLQLAECGTRSGRADQCHEANCDRISVTTLGNENPVEQ